MTIDQEHFLDVRNFRPQNQLLVIIKCNIFIGMIFYVKSIWIHPTNM